MLRHKAWLAEHTARIETELASKVKSEFIANMSHELRTPLNTVIGFSKLLGEHRSGRLKDAEIVEYADLIHDAATHLLAVINDILDISKMQSGKYTLDAREVELDEILQAALASFRPTAAEAGVALECRHRSGPAHGQGRSGQAAPGLHQPHQQRHQVHAARRHGDDRGARAAPTAAPSCACATPALGMTEEEIAVALTPFGQVDASRSRWREGTGLGLPIAKALVQLHGGRLEIRSAKSLGHRGHRHAALALRSVRTCTAATRRCDAGAKQAL